MTIDKQIEEALPYFRDTDEYLSDNFGDVVLHKDLIAACLQAILEVKEELEPMFVYCCFGHSLGECGCGKNAAYINTGAIKTRVKEIMDGRT